MHKFPLYQRKKQLELRKGLVLQGSTLTLLAIFCRSDSFGNLMHCLFITPIAFRSKPSTLKLSIKTHGGW